MNIKIDLVISASPELLTSLQALTGKTAPATVQAPVIASPENGEVKKTRKLKVPSEPLNASDKEIAAMEKEETKQEEIKTDLTVDFLLSEAVPRSKAGHKDKIKAKVAEMGYESLVDMQPEHFNEMWSFLQTIPKPA